MGQREGVERLPHSADAKTAWQADADPDEGECAGHELVALARAALAPGAAGASQLDALSGAALLDELAHQQEEIQTVLADLLASLGLDPNDPRSIERIELRIETTVEVEVDANG